MKFKNLLSDEKRDEVIKNLFDALTAGDDESQKEAFKNFTDMLQSAIIEEAERHIDNMGNTITDEKILADRGILKPLTSAEKKFYNAVIEKKGFENVEEVMPQSVFEEVFKRLKEEHPILSKIDIQNVGALTKYIFANPTKARAFWGTIDADIKQIILEAFEEVEIRSAKLSGFVPVSKGMLELGPVWLSNYVTTLMYEIMSASLELAIIQGDGKNQPIGMMKKLSGATDSVYPDKEKITIADLTPKSLAGIKAAMAKAKLATTGSCVFVNPITYWAKVFHNVAFRTQDGVWVNTKLPTGDDILTSYAVPEDVLIFGDPSNYFVGISGEVRIDKYTETLAIEDMDLYIAKFFGYGIAKDKNAFFVADIATIESATVPELEKHKNNTGNNKDSIITKTTVKQGV